MSEHLVPEGLVNSLRDFAEFGEEIAAQCRVKAQRLKSSAESGTYDEDDVSDAIQRLSRLASIGSNLTTMVEALAEEAGYEPRQTVAA